MLPAKVTIVEVGPRDGLQNEAAVISTIDKVSFVENFNFQGNDLKITYTGTVVSADEIKFHRDVSGLAQEDLVAKRSK